MHSHRRSPFSAALAGSVALISCSAAPVLGATVGAWDFSTVTGTGASPYAPASTDPNATVGGLTRGPGVIPGAITAPNRAWGGTGFDAASVGDAITAGDFITFTVKAKPGYTLSLSDIGSYNVQHPPIGPDSGQWQYSTDGATFTDIGGAILWGVGPTPNGSNEPSVDLSTISALQGLPSTTTVTFRLVTWGAVIESGAWFLNEPFTPPPSDDADFTINGTLTKVPGVVPLPSAAMMGLVLCSSLCLYGRRRPVAYSLAKSSEFG